ncbi:hypothetical protein WJX73_007472 [Symbiochloris irregularis]|uniref:Phosphoglycerate mutase n=1 Tax=Symbiochloris irregularis TaxID=706552 RepID=A0AAW1NX71_9CHLO
MAATFCATHLCLPCIQRPLLRKRLAPVCLSSREASLPSKPKQAVSLTNEFWLLRHGRSKANELGIIVSLPEGKLQAEEAGKKLAAAIKKKDKSQIYIYCSPFSRTVETAVIAARHLGISEHDANFQIADELRERFFGSFELQSHENYVPVWTQDQASSDYQPPGDGESVAQVAARIWKLCDRIEQEHSGCTVILVSHGDTLSIAWAALTDQSLLDNRKHGLVTGEVRLLDAKTHAFREVNDLS